MLVSVTACNFFKSGTGKNGKPYTMYKAQLADGREATGFVQVAPGTMVEVTETQNGQYTNLNYALQQGNAAQAAPDQQQAAPAATPAASGSDPRVLKLMVLICEQVGVPTERIQEVLNGQV